MTAVECAACGSVYRGKALAQLSSDDVWRREDGVLHDRARCLCGEWCDRPHPEMGDNVVLVTMHEGGGAYRDIVSPRTIDGVTADEWVMGSSEVWRVAFHRNGHDRGRSVWPTTHFRISREELLRLEAWVATLPSNVHRSVASPAGDGQGSGRC